MSIVKARLTYDDIKNMCVEFINDGDIIIALENRWSDWMIKTIDLDYSKEEIMEALNVTTTKYAVRIPVKWTYGGVEDDWTMYVAVYDHSIQISTHEQLLCGIDDWRNVDAAMLKELYPDI